jgi:hypothetical protein
VRGSAGAALLLVLGGGCAAGCAADGLEGRFEVRSADLELKDGVYHLNARIDLPVSDAVRRGLAEGVPLTSNSTSTSSGCASCCRTRASPS